MITVDEAGTYLIEHGFIGVEAILDGELVITSTPRRNRNLRVVQGDRPGFLIKQPDPGNPGAFQTLANEAAFYQACEDLEALEGLRPFLPRLRMRDEQHALFGLELLPEAVPLWQRYTRSGAAAFPHPIPEAVGTALGTIHRCGRKAQLETQLPWLQDPIPWALKVHKPGPELFGGLSHANFRTIQIIQTMEGIAGNLDRLRRLWRAETIIHNDVKSDNLLVLRAPDGQESIRIVDWELVQWGDPAWDVAGMLQDFVLFWLFSMTDTQGSSEAMAASAAYPLKVLQPAIRRFWMGYRTAAGLDDGASTALLARAVPFSAARLIQSAYELAQTAPALPAQSILLLQISANLLRDPEGSQVQLYGLFQSVKP